MYGVLQIIEVKKNKVCVCLIYVLIFFNNFINYNMNKNTIKYIQKIIILLITILFIYTVFKSNNNIFMNKKEIILPKYNVGNILSVYLFHIYKSYLNNESYIVFNNVPEILHNIIPNKININKKIPTETKNYLKKLEKKYNLFEEGFWSYKIFIKHINFILKDNIKLQKNKDIDIDCLIHIRCSDVPFERNNYYHLILFKWYVDAINICKSKINIEQITILFCNTHPTREINNIKKEKCNEWTNLLINYIETNLKIKCKLECSSLDNDIQKLINCKSLITTSSSLSFTLGLLSDNILVYPSDEYETISMDCVKVRDNSYCLKKQFIKHRDVDDYYNFNNKRLLS